MGVKNFWKIIEGCKQPIDGEKLKRKRIAIDISIWLHEAKHVSEVRPHMISLYHRICKLLIWQIEPIFVFDGAAPRLKRKTLERRRRRENVLRQKNERNKRIKEVEKLFENFEEDDGDLEATSSQLSQSQHSSRTDESLRDDNDESDYFKENDLEVMANKNESDFSQSQLNSFVKYVRDKSEVERKKISFEHVVDGDEFVVETGIHMNDHQLQYFYMKKKEEESKTPVEDDHKIKEQLLSNENLIFENRTSNPRRMKRKIEDFQNYHQLSESEDEILEKLEVEENCQMKKMKKEEIKISNNKLIKKEIKFSNEKLKKEEIKSEQFTKSLSLTNCLISHEIADDQKEIIKENSNYLLNEKNIELYDKNKNKKKFIKIKEEIKCGNDMKLNANNLELTTIGKKQNRDNIENFSDSKKKINEKDNAMELKEENEISKKSKKNETEEIDSSIILIDEKINNNPIIIIDDENDEGNSLIIKNDEKKDDSIIIVDEDIEDKFQNDVDILLINNEMNLNEKTDFDQYLIDCRKEICQEFLTNPENPVMEVDPLKEEISNDISRKYFASLSNEKQFDQIVNDAKELLSLFGIPFICATSEAEAQCAFLEMEGYVDGIITDDSDVFLFGGRNIYRNFFHGNIFRKRKTTLKKNSSNDNGYYSMDNIEKELKLHREHFIFLAIILGCDYCDGIFNCGVVKAMKILKQHNFKGNQNSIENLKKFKNWVEENKGRNSLSKLELPDNFPNEAVHHLFISPSIYRNLRPESLKSVNIHQDLLQKFCKIHFRWNEETFSKNFFPITKILKNQKEQQKISSFFKTK
ncbi:hypothetical protein SNEBB_007962 [Seison nebaliae]|nr:hypothetical protein SNEBB_007962 [Seison nebaliae]